MRLRFARFMGNTMRLRNRLVTLPRKLSLHACIKHTVLEMSLKKRGSSICRSYGHSNGNRALQCKGCSSPLTKKARLTPRVSPEANINVSALLSSKVLPPGSQIYSVRVRDQGPDYR